MKTKKEDIINAVTSVALPICEKIGAELYDVDFYKEGADYTLCVLIDKKGGVSIDDCENVSRELDPLLDDIDPIDCQYCLEVSSCGVDRKLSKPSHFEGAVGERIRLGFYTPIDGSKHASGTLVSYGDDGVCIALADKTVKKFALKDIASAKIDVDLDALLASDK